MSQTNQKSDLDARLINPIVAATVEVLGTMADTKANLKEVLPVLDYKPTGDISAVIGIIGPDGEGVVALSFPKLLANLIVSRMLGIEAEGLSIEDCCDGIAELVNMISGNAKTALSQDSTATYKLSLPSIITGAGHEIAHRPRKSPYLVILFEVEEQLFALQLSFQANE